MYLLTLWKTRRGFPLPVRYRTPTQVWCLHQVVLYSRNAYLDFLRVLCRGFRERGLWPLVGLPKIWHAAAGGLDRRRVPANFAAGIHRESCRWVPGTAAALTGWSQLGIRQLEP